MYLLMHTPTHTPILIGNKMRNTGEYHFEICSNDWDQWKISGRLVGARMKCLVFSLILKHQTSSSMIKHGIRPVQCIDTM